MNRPTASVIKHDEVKVAGKVRLDSLLPGAANTANASHSSQNPRATVPVSARIVKTAEDHVMIEMTCSCGTKTMLRCNY